jgi:disulfide bond formation protein DsbB
MPRLNSRQIALLLGGVSAALLIGAYLFQYVGGLPPCTMCWWQRYAHFAVVGLASAALVAPAAPGRALAALAALAMLVGAGLGGFHLGVEQGWWQGPTACSGDTLGGLTLEQLRQGLDKARIVRCDEVLWSFLGVSMAGWNMVISGLAGLVGLGLLVKR